MTRVGFYFVPAGECRSLTVWFWIRARLDLSAFVTAIAGLRRDEIRSGFQNAISQRILNCALSVDFLWKKIRDRTNPELLWKFGPEEIRGCDLLKFRFKKVRFSDAVAAFGANFPR